VAQTADGAVLAARLQPQNAEGLGDDDALLAVVWRGHALEDLQALHGLGAALSLVGDHAADGAPEDLGGAAVVPGAAAGGVETGLLAEEGLVLHCAGGAWLVYRVRRCVLGVVRSADSGRRTLGPEELAGDVEGLAADDDDLLTVQELLGDGAGEAAQQVALRCPLVSSCSPLRALSRIPVVVVVVRTLPSMTMTGSKVDMVPGRVRVVVGCCRRANASLDARCVEVRLARNFDVLRLGVGASVAGGADAWNYRPNLHVISVNRAGVDRRVWRKRRKFVRAATSSSSLQAC
jgi:hypothetical protein